MHINLICGDALDLQEHFDGIFSTGLIQCLNPETRDNFLKYMASISDRAVFTVPEIIQERNIDTDVQVAVAGCQEYTTKNIPYELSRYWNLVNAGRIDKKSTGLDDNFIYYICKNK